MTVLSPIRNLPVVISLTGTEEVPLDQGGTTKRATVQQISQAFIVPFPAAIEAVIDGSNSLIQTGLKGYLVVPFPVTITGAFMFANTAGTITVDIWKCTTAQFDPDGGVPSAANTITGGTGLALTGSALYQNTSLAGWTTSLTTGDVLAYNVSPGVAGITRVTVSLSLTRVLT